MVIAAWIVAGLVIAFLFYRSHQQIKRLRDSLEPLSDRLFSFTARTEEQLATIQKQVKALKSAPAESPSFDPIESSTSAPAESPSFDSIENSTSAPAESPSFDPIESSTSAPAESPSFDPVESSTSSPVESSASTPAESPNGKGPSEEEDENLKVKFQAFLDDEVNPAVAAHGGIVTLIDIQDRVAFVQMGGGCQGCGMVSVTLKQGIEARMNEVMPEIKELVDTTDHRGGTNPYYQPGKGSPMM